MAIIGLIVWSLLEVEFGVAVDKEELVWIKREIAVDKEKSLRMKKET